MVPAKDARRGSQTDRFDGCSVTGCLLLITLGVLPFAAATLAWLGISAAGGPTGIVVLVAIVTGLLAFFLTILWVIGIQWMAAQQLNSDSRQSLARWVWQFCSGWASLFSIALAPTGLILAVVLTVRLVAR